jgi:tetratricopeptide (TPR) repeat protein
MEGLNRCLLGLAAQKPLLLLLEDLHWAADSTLMWLHALGRQVGSAPLLIVGTYRQEEVGAGHPLREWMRELRREGWGALLTVHPLAGEAVQILVQALSGLGENAAVLARRLQDESEGNPFFLSELLRHLQELGQLRRQEGLWTGPWVESAVAGEDRRLPLPESVREAILGRVERLDGEPRELLRYAAVAGREFDLNVLQSAIRWGEEQVLDALDELLARGLVREGGIAKGRDHVFNHHLVQEVTYEALPQARRRVRHRRLGEAMAAANSEEAAGELAYHFEQAGVEEQALKYLKLAGEQAAARYASVEAIDYYSRALALLADEALEARFDLLAARVEVWDWLWRREEQRADLEALEATARALDDGPLPRLGQSITSLRLARTYLLWANFYDGTADYTAGTQAAQRALALFQEAGDRRGEAQSLYSLGSAARHQADYSTAHDYFQYALALSQELGDRRGEAQGVRSLGALATLKGDYAAALLYFEQALETYRELGDRSEEAGILLWLGEVIITATGDYVEGRAIFEQGLALSRAIGTRGLEDTFLGQLGLVSQWIGEFELAEDYFRQELFICQEIGDVASLGECLRSQATLAWQLGEDTVAILKWEQALELFRTIGDLRREARILRFLGNLMRQKREYQSAHKYLEQAHKIFRQIGRRRGIAGDLLELGQLAWDEGDAAPAADDWREAATLFDSLGITTDAQACRARLGEALVHLNQEDEARPLAEAVWAAWQAEPPLGEDLDEIRHGYLALARTFARLDEPQKGQACLEQAHTFIQARLSHIKDEARRQSFLQVPVNREIEAEYAGFRE